MGKLKINFQVVKSLCLTLSTSRQLSSTLIAVTLLFSSCNTKEKSTSAPTANLQHIIDSAKQIPTIHNKTTAQAGLDYINAGFGKAQNATPFDLNNYYAFKFVIENRDFANYDKALLLADSMIMNITNNHLEKVMDREYANALYSKGDAFFGKGEYDDAYSYYVQGKIAGQQYFSICDLSDYSYHIGRLLYKQERYKEAAGYFKQCFDQAASCTQKFDVFYRRQEALDNAGLCYDAAFMTDSALATFKQVLGFIYLNNDKYPQKKKEFFDMARGVVYGNMANVYIKTEKYAVADSLLRLSISINTVPGNDINDAVYSYLKQARLYSRTGERDKMLVALKWAKQTLDTIPNAEALLNWHYLMSTYYQAKKDNDSALIYLNSYLDLQKQREKELKELRRTDYVERLKMQESQEKIASLQKQNNFKEFFLVVGGLLGIMALFIIGLIYRNAKRSKKYIQSLTSLNNKIRENSNDLKEALARLENHDKEKDRMLRAVAHDLRTPIAGIAALTDLMMDDEDLTADQRETLNLISNSANTSLTLSKEILEATTGFTPEKWQFASIDLGHMLNSQAELLRLRAKEKDQTIQLNLPAAPVKVLANPEKLSRAITNIVINAIKFSPAKSNISIALKEEEKRAIITIRDEGIGIPNIMKNKIFDMFTEAKRYGTAGEKPFGLGLSIARQIVEAHQGIIEVESMEGMGSTFKISLPV